MKTVFSTGPGFYAAATRETDDMIPAGQMRFFVARLEAYDGPIRADDVLKKTEFKILPAMASGDRQVARALLQLHAALTANLEQLRTEAGE